jgi:hypothetical protein
MAAITGDLIALLDKIPIWKRVQEAPQRIDALEKRIADLEGRLAKAPGEACPACGDWSFRMTSAVPVRGPMGQGGARDVTKKCEVCGFEDTRRTTK